MTKELEKIKETLLPVLKANGVEFAGVFGSFARGEETEKSDIDILVKFSGMPTFDGYLRLDEDLHRVLGRDVDLVTTGAVNKYLKPQIEQDIQIIYGQRPDLPTRD